MTILLSECQQDSPTQITRFGKERMKQYCILFPPSLVEKIDEKRGLIDRSVWIRDKLASVLGIKLYNEKGVEEAPKLIV